MLVLARRLHEKIILPTLDTTIQVVGLQGNMVRLGIEAPRDVTIYREEVFDPAAALADADRLAVPGHDVRNRLNNLGLGLALLQRQLPATLHAEARKTLEQVHAQFVALKAQVQALLDDQPERQPQLTS